MLLRTLSPNYFLLFTMGACLSICFSPTKPNQNDANQQRPTSYAANVAQNAVNIVSDMLAAPQQNSNSHPSPPTGAEGMQVIHNAYVFKMPDGDTFTCEYTNDAGEKATARVRIMAIDCPETMQNFGYVLFLLISANKKPTKVSQTNFLLFFFRQQATDIGQKMLLRTSVTLYVHTTDRYKRLVADVITQDSLNFGEQMLREGAAWHYKAYDKRQNLAQLETEARNAKIGLWSFPRPLEPWKYRSRKRENAK